MQEDKRGIFYFNSYEAKFLNGEDRRDDKVKDLIAQTCGVFAGTCAFLLFEDRGREEMGRETVYEPLELFCKFDDRSLQKVPDVEFRVSFGDSLMFVTAISIELMMEFERLLRCPGRPECEEREEIVLVAAFNSVPSVVVPSS